MEEDFDPDVPSIVMLGNEIRKCTNVTIMDDQIVERMEPFEVTITFPPGQPALQIGEVVPPAPQLNGTINIIDDDGEHTWNRIIHSKSFYISLYMCALHFILENTT